MSASSNRRGFFKALLGDAGHHARDLHETLGPLSPLHRLDALDALTSPPAPDIGLDEIAPGGAAPERPRRAEGPHRCATLPELQALAVEAGLGARADDIARLARRCVHLIPARPPQPAEPGASRLGGSPELPPGLTWPSWQGEPLSFLVGIDLADIAFPDDDEDLLPPTGALLFFGPPDDAPSGLLAEHRGSTQVVFAASAAPPGDAPPDPDRPAGCAVELAPQLVLPRVWAEPVRALRLEGPEGTAWEQLREDLAEAQGAEPSATAAEPLIMHHLLGYPHEAEGGMPLICELLDRGEDVADGRADTHPRAAELAEPARRWRLLLQLSVDEHVGWPSEAPDGRLYVWIDEDALRDRDFSRVYALAR